LDEVARVRPEGSIPDEIAWQLAWLQRPADLNRSLEWSSLVADRATKRGLTQASPIRHLDFALFSRANALKSLAEGSEPKALEEAEGLFRRLIGSTVVSEVAYEQLIEVCLGDGRLDETNRLLSVAQARWPKNSTFFIQKFWVDLLAGKTQAAAATASEADERAGKDKEQDIGLLFVAALGQILTQSGSWEHAARRLIGSTHQYVDYIHMMLYASLAESKVNNARELLDQRWARINRASWDARMRHGDESAWRERPIDRARRVDRRLRVRGLETTRRLGPVDSRHAHVDEDEIGIDLCHKAQGLFSARGFSERLEA
jgi:hypothetical protein